MFDNILNWKLLKGSHKFPGPDGGTCINEAAIIAAGFEYKRVGVIDDCPPCFSKVISRYALDLNDQMPDRVRQKLLLPFVTRLAGTASTKEIEQKRVELIVVRTIKEILPATLMAAGLADHALKCEQATDFKTAAAAANAANAAAYAASASAAAAAASASAAYAAANAANAAAYAASASAPAASASASASAAARAVVYAAAAAESKVWTIAISILNEAINLGKSEPIEIGLAVDRLNKAKELAAAR